MTDDVGIPGAHIPTQTLTGDDEAQYVQQLLTIIRAARLNNQYPDSRLISSHLSGLSPKLHRGLYPGVEVNLKSGLPSYKEWTRVQTDARIATDQLRQLGSKRDLEAKVRKNPSSQIHQKQLAKFDYYSAMSKVRTSPLGDMNVALRKLEPKEHRAYFHIVLDKLDVSGTFVRYSIDLSQTADFWNEKIVILDEEAAKHTESFRSLVYKFTSYDAEFTFVKLATIGGLSVERVIKGVIGPFYFPWVQGSEAVKNLVGPGQCLAMFSLDMAAIDVSADRDNDPFEDLIIERLSKDARRGYEEARKQYHYRVFKDKKFVLSRALIPGLKKICESENTKNIMYPI